MNRLKVGMVALLLTAFLGSGVASAEVAVGVGYQGLYAGEFLNGASVRAWMDSKWAVEGDIFQANIDVGNTSTDIWFLGGKALYAPIIRENSQFYVGLSAGYGKLGASDVLDNDVDGWIVGPLFGAEYRFQGLPNLGFNWEVGYNFASIDFGDGAPDVDLNGVTISLGAHYRLN